MKSLGPRGGRGWRRFFVDEGGAVAIYVAFVSVVLVGVAALVFDVGRLAVVRAQMQNAADAAATAAAVQLDGADGARERAEAVARGAASQNSGIKTASGSTEIEIDDVNFFTDAEGTPARSDAEAAFVEVTVRPRPVTLMLAPVLAAMTDDDNARDVTELNARALATSAPIVCDPPPLMVCNPNEQGLLDITSAAASGREILLRDGGNNPAPGNFGLMCPPDTPNCGAGDVEAFLAADSPEPCTASAMSTKPGVNFARVNNGINARFDIGPLANPARDIMSFPRDRSFQANLVGDGVWDPETYWADAHTSAFPAALDDTATRFQVYLYELGERFARDGPATVFPLPDDLGDLAPGFDVVTPPGEDIPAAGVPTSAPVEDPRRRIMKAAVVQCEALGVRGRTDIDLRDMDLIELFIAEPVTGTGASAPIVGEVVRTLRAGESTDIVNNVRLVE